MIEADFRKKEEADDRGRDIRLTREAVVALEIFLRVLLKKHKLHNLIKRKIHILTTTIKKKYANT